MIVLVVGVARRRRAAAAGPACAPIRLLATVYVDVFRGVPALLVILIVGFGLPQADVPLLGEPHRHGATPSSRSR